MFIFIGGIQPRIKRLSSSLRSCPVCGAYPLLFQRVDQYLSLFFIPLFPVKKGRPYFLCKQCSSIFRSDGSQIQKVLPVSGRCPGCGKSLLPDFIYCPYCGRSVRD